jgi:hypothetical protein
VRPILARILRESGNFLHVLGNKITPKSADRKSQTPGRPTVSAEHP